MPTVASAGRIAAVRRFNRFYTRRIGVLQEHLLDGPFTLTAARVLYELAQRRRATASELGADLGLDAGYLSRLLRDFTARGLLHKASAPGDRRRVLVSLTARGRRAFATLDAAARADVAGLLAPLAPDAQWRLVDAMRAIEHALGAPGTANGRAAPIRLRRHRPGDIGWVVQRHGMLYAREYGWDERFEGLVAGIVATFLRAHDPRRERCWIAERDGERLGTVFLVRRSPTVGQLRLLLVEPHARGLGLGRRLVEECIRFARRARYRKIMLWTNDVLHAARRIYERTGFHLVRENRHTSFGHRLTGQIWARAL